MTGQRKSYKELLKSTPYPQISPELFKVKIDYRGLRNYAQNQGKPIIDLSDEEKNMFILNSDMNSIRALQ